MQTSTLIFVIYYGLRVEGVWSCVYIVGMVLGLEETLFRMFRAISWFSCGLDWAEKL